MKHIGLIAGLAMIATLLLLAGCHRDGKSGVLLPCSDPAPLNGKPDPAAPGVFVELVPGVDVQQEADRLAKKYRFTVNNVYSWGTFFVAQMAPEVVNDLRCEPTVRSLEYNSVVHLVQ